MALLQLPLVALAQEDPGRHTAVIAQVDLEDDADQFGARRIRGGLLLDYQSPFRYLGVAAQTTHFTQNGWNADALGVVGLYRRQSRETLEGLVAEGGLVSVSGHTRLIGDATWSYRPRSTTGIELIAAADLVGTREALERGIGYKLIAASAEQQFGDRLTAIVLGGWQPFTDGNSRALLKARLIWSLIPEQGVSAQLRWRQYTSSERDVGGAYFNPDRYRQWDSVLSFRRRYRAWILSGLAGAGQESVEDGPWKSTGTFEVRAEGPLTNNINLAFNALYSRAAGFSGSPDYWYATVGINLIVPLKR